MAATPEPKPTVTDGKSIAKPPDEMDEKMRHCPLALDGAQSALQDIDGGVRFLIKGHEMVTAVLPL